MRGDLSQATRAWALGRRAALGLPADSTLVSTDAFGTRFGASFHLSQQLDGLDVWSANLVVTLDSSARVMLVTSSLQSYREARKGWLIGEAEAVRRAAAQVPLPLVRSDGTPYGAAKQVWFPLGDEVHAGWLAHVPTADPRRYFLVRIDATTGEVLGVQNRVFNAQLDANVYPISPGGLDAGVGVAPTVKVSLTHADGGPMLAADAGSVLSGTQLDAYNCCVWANCDPNAPDAGPKRSVGQLMFGATTVHFDMVACDFKHVASNDPAVHDAGSFEYPPVDPPMAGAFALADPANTDEFSEVQAFYQVNREYDWVRGLSRAAAPIFPGNTPTLTPFQMRDEKKVPSRKPTIWSNVVFPDFLSLMTNPACLFTGTTCVINNFTRLDNAAFIAVENFAQLPIREYQNDVDTLMIFQGGKADFGYDAPVLWHEFGHGVVYSTANLGFDTLSFDGRSTNNESGALHEAFGDFFAGAFGGDPDMGRYVGPRLTGTTAVGINTESFLRSLDNQLSCPNVLHGEVHDDSQHVAAALWRARMDSFKGTDNGARYDATFYAALVSLSNTADFAQLAQVMTAHAESAFPDGGQVMTDLFNARGVTNCDKIVDVTDGTPRPMYGIGTRTQGGYSGGFVPGPHQLKVHLPNGAKSVTVTAQLGSDITSILGGNTMTQLKVLMRPNNPILFTKVSNVLQSNAIRTVDMTVSNGGAQAVVDVDMPCMPSSDVYLTIANAGANPVTLGNLTVAATPLGACVPDGGMDAGMTTTTPGIQQDGGTQDVFEGPMVQKGCGCGAAPIGAPLLLLIMLARRRRRSR